MSFSLLGEKGMFDRAAMQKVTGHATYEAYRVKIKKTCSALLFYKTFGLQCRAALYKPD